jgi:hypothetical protein
MQMLDPMWIHLNDCFFKHGMASDRSPLCGRFIMFDGNAKLYRSHCKQKVVTSPNEVEMAGGFLYTVRNYCSESPLPKKAGYCAEHYLEHVAVCLAGVL